MMNLENLSFTEKNLHFKKGNYIFKEREESGGKMYFIDSGWVEIRKKVGDGEVILALLELSNFFGELGLLTGNERIASAVAFTDCKLHTMDKETLEIIKTKKPELVILDIMIPGMSGFEVCNTMKNVLEMKDICILMLTAKVQEVDRQKGKDVGADIYMTKPFNPDEVFEKVTKVLEIEII